eukprot:TRINITY_DN5843_c0_g1_i8.p1 TRINITY_DN5843_c0_g1~~TRINITY_DN5843_c0_g1_i8.p1  ORF type:complete len:705 (+),score=126.58 TRINITY_DN5843_c0_g1_i8:129-2243(+)
MALPKEPVIIFKCQEKVLTVPLLLLCKESPLFIEKFSKFLTPVNTTEPTGEENDDQSNRGDKSDKETVVQMPVIDLDRFSVESVTTLFDYLQGCSLSLESIDSMQDLEDMIKLCQELEITRPITDILARVRQPPVSGGFAITKSNLVETFEVAGRLSKQEEFKQVGEDLVERCVNFARFNLATRRAVLDILLKNRSRKEQVVKLLDILYNGLPATIRFCENEQSKLSGERGGRKFIMNNHEWYLEYTDYAGKIAINIGDHDQEIKEMRWRVKLIGGKEAKSKNEVIFADTSKKHTYRLPEERKILDGEEILIEAKVQDIDDLYPRDDPITEYTGELIWYAKESYHMEALMKNSNDQTENIDPTPIMLECRGSLICAKKSVLRKESIFFGSKFGAYWEHADIDCSKKLEEDKDDKGNKDFRVVAVPDSFDPEALKILIDHLHGNSNKFTSFLTNLTLADLSLLCQILELCDYYGILRVVKDVLKQLEDFPILVGYELAQKLAEMPFYQNLAESVKQGCIDYIREHLVDRIKVMYFIQQDNIAIGTVLALLAEVEVFEEDEACTRYKTRLPFSRFNDRTRSVDCRKFAVADSCCKIRLLFNEEEATHCELIIYGESHADISGECSGEVYSQQDWSKHPLFGTTEFYKEAGYDRESISINLDRSKVSFETFKESECVYIEIAMKIEKDLPKADLQETDLTFPEVKLF